VFVLSIVPVEPKVEVPHLDKAIHLCEYLLFAWMLMQAVRASRMPEPDYRLWVWIYATSYGLLIEIVQAMVPWRSADVADALMNAIGAAAGVWIGERFPP
jgi:VanZ family protein